MGRFFLVSAKWRDSRSADLGVRWRGRGAVGSHLSGSGGRRCERTRAVAPTPPLTLATALLARISHNAMRIDSQPAIPERGEGRARVGRHVRAGRACAKARVTNVAPRCARGSSIARIVRPRRRSLQARDWSGRLRGRTFADSSSPRAKRGATIGQARLRAPLEFGHFLNSTDRVTGRRS